MATTKEHFLQFIASLPRLIRIIIVTFFTLMLVATIFPLVDHIYIRFFFTESTTIVPSLVTVVIGALFYLWGWMTYVGMVGTKPTARNMILWYFVLGGVVTVLALGLLIYGVYDLSIPTETA